jgi:hypothetical protein
MSTHLPYTDTKPVGAADFYLAINATFRFLLKKLGKAGLERYWQDLGRRYLAPVSEQWRAGGLDAVANYWRDFFAAEPGAEVHVEKGEHEVTLSVKTCPALKHLRAQGREVVPCFCQHCYFVNQAAAEVAGMAVRVEGGNGSCVQRFMLAHRASAQQNLSEIKEVMP